MTQYFLGLLPAEEAERLDEQSIADADLARRLRVVEHDLVDAYVRGALDPATRMQFERAYLTSARRREKVRFAESLRRAVDRSPTTTPTATPTPTPTSAPAPPAPAPAPARARRAGFTFGWGSLVLGAAAVLLIVTGGLLLQAMRLRQELTTAQSERAALDRRTQELQQQLDAQTAAKTETVKELDRLRALLDHTMEQAVSAGGGAAEQSLRSGLLTTAALVLSPQTRSIAAVPTLRVPPAGVAAASFRLLLETNPFASYQVTLKDPGTNAIIWRSERIAPSSGREGPSVAVAVPARLLKAQHYSLDLSGIGASGHTELLGSYAFQVLRR